MQDIDITSSHPLSPAAKMRAYRQRMRDAGMRPIQLWVPDIRSQHLQQEAKRQSMLVANKDNELLDFIEEAGDW